MMAPFRRVVGFEPLNRTVRTLGTLAACRGIASRHRPQCLFVYFDPALNVHKGAGSYCFVRMDVGKPVYSQHPARK